MQSAPLAGTATTSRNLRQLPQKRCNPHPSRGRQRFFLELLIAIFRCNPHPSRGRQLFKGFVCLLSAYRCNPHPSRGRQPVARLVVVILRSDAIRRHRRTCRFTAASRLPIGVLPRKRLASSATGGASPLSPCGDGNSKIPQHPSFCLDAIRKHRRTCRFPDALRLPIGVFPRKRLAFSATGGTSPLSHSGVNTEAVFSASVYFCAKAFLRCPRSPVAQDLSASPGLYLDPQHLFPAVMDKGKLRFTSPVRQNIHLPCGFPAGDRPQNGAPVSYMQQAA